MARARNIKPGFFRNEELAELPAITRILFAGLWTVADRQGRLEDRPKRIKADILPYDDEPVDPMLDRLAESGFILRYGSGATRYIQIINFAKHQNPHKNEAESEIPSPEEYGASTVQAPESSGEVSVSQPELYDSTRADSLNLIPDSLNPDSHVQTGQEVEDVTTDCAHPSMESGAPQERTMTWDQGKTTPPGPALAPAPIIDQASRERYEEFRMMYPDRRRGGVKNELMRLWSALTPDEQSMAITGLRGWLTSDEWSEKDGQFIPGIKRFLEEERWRNAPAPKKKVKPGQINWADYGMA